MGGRNSGSETWTGRQMVVAVSLKNIYSWPTNGGGGLSKMVVFRSDKWRISKMRIFDCAGCTIPKMALSKYRVSALAKKSYPCRNPDTNFSKGAWLAYLARCANGTKETLASGKNEHFRKIRRKNEQIRSFIGLSRRGYRIW